MQPLRWQQCCTAVRVAEEEELGGNGKQSCAAARDEGLVSFTFVAKADNERTNSLLLHLVVKPSRTWPQIRVGKHGKQA